MEQEPESILSQDERDQVKALREQWDLAMQHALREHPLLIMAAKAIKNAGYRYEFGHAISIYKVPSTHDCFSSLLTQADNSILREMHVIIPE